MTLAKYIGNPAPRGAFSRFAEATGLSFSTIVRIYNGERASKSALKIVADAMKKRVKLFQKARSDKGKPRGEYRKNAKR